MKTERLLALENHPETRIRIDRLRRRSAKDPSGLQLQHTQDAARKALRTAVADDVSSSAPHTGLPRFRVRRLPVLATVVLVVVGTAAVLTAGYSVARSLGVEWLRAGGDRTVIATVGDETITRSDIEQSKVSEKYMVLTMGLYGDDFTYVPLTDSALLDRMIEDRIVYQEAVRQGFTFTDEQVDEVIAYQKEIQAEYQDDPVMAEFSEYIGGMGYTLDEYWQFVRPMLKRAFVSSQLQRKVIEGATAAERAAVWDKYKADLVRQHKSEIHIYAEP
jgi:hypothetical protein